MLGCPQQLAPGAQGRLPHAARVLPAQGDLWGAGGAADLPSTSTEIDLKLHGVYKKNQTQARGSRSLGFPWESLQFGSWVYITDPAGLMRSRSVRAPSA